MAFSPGFSVKNFAVDRNEDRSGSIMERTSLNGGDGPPAPLIGDVFKTILLCVLFIMGTPLNLMATCLLRKSWSKKNWLVAETNMLKRHLNFSDLFILFFYCSSEIGWLLTYSWRGGLIMCKLVAFLRLLAFQISSNIIVCIALMRFLSTVIPPPAAGKWRHLRVKMVISSAWALAILTSSPQLAVWTLVEYPGQTDWKQCVPVWERTFAAPSNRTNSVKVKLAATEQQQKILNFDLTLGSEMKWLKTGYHIYHLLVVFWIPFILIAVFYGILITKIWILGARTTKNIIFERQSVKSRASQRSNNIKSWDQTELESLKQHGHGNDHPNDHDDVDFEDSAVVDINDANGYFDGETTGDAVALRSIVSAQKRTMRVSIILTIAYVVCWTPYLAMDTWKMVHFRTYNHYGQNIPQIFNALIVFNSVLNPYLYGMFNAVREWSS